MELDEYFEVVAPDDIRIKGTRIGIESVLYAYIHQAQTPEEITRRFHTLTLEQVYATILYYLRHRETVSAYLAAWLEFGRQARAEQAHNPPPQLAPALERLRALRAARTPATNITP